MMAILALLKAKAAFAAAGMGGAALAVLISRIVPSLVGKWADKYLGKALDVSNPDDKELVLALVKWAEKRVPESGQGKEKFAAVSAKIVAMMPVMKRYEDRLTVLIEESVEKLNQELKKKSA